MKKRKKIISILILSFIISISALFVTLNALSNASLRRAIQELEEIRIKHEQERNQLEQEQQQEPQYYPNEARPEVTF